MIWAIKESAYKAFQQIDPNIKSSARNFVVSKNQTSVSYRGLGALSVELEVNANYIFASVASQDDEAIHKLVEIQGQETQSQAARRAANALFSLPGSIIKNSHGIPVYLTNLGDQLPVSLTHHGRFAAATTLKPKPLNHGRP